MTISDMMFSHRVSPEVFTADYCLALTLSLPCPVCPDPGAHLTPPPPPVTQSAPHHIVSIQALGQRVFVSDVQESVFYVRYKRQENQLILFADDTNQRWVTATCLLDYDTVAAADKFGNVSVVSCCTRRRRFYVLTRILLPLWESD